MTIQRHYSLPNCKIVLEGLGNDLSLSPEANGRSPLSMITNVECHLVGQDRPLTGGREFLEHLITAVSGYAQECLSGISHVNRQTAQPAPVRLERLSTDLHRLTIHPDATLPINSAEPIQIEMGTVQLFDLVEAIDQLLADGQGVPNLAPSLSPVSRRYAIAQEPLSKRVIPATVGISGLAIASALLFLLPLPEIRRPEPVPEQTSQELPAASPVPTGSPPVGNNPPPPAAEQPSSDEAAAPDAEGNPSPETNATTANPSPGVESPLAARSPNELPSPTTSPTTDPGASPTTGDDSLTALLDSSPQITDPDQIDRLNRQLRDKLARAWNDDPTFDDELVYRVGVGTNGDVLGFRYVNDASVDHVNQTPLLDLRYTPTQSGQPEPIAEFRVVFTPRGVVQVSPWHGRVR